MNRRTVISILVILALTVAPAFAQSKTAKARIHANATSLAATLHDAQTNVDVSAAVWRVVANEANSLANKLYGATSGNATARAAARDLRMHVREMRTAALAGNAAEARRHAAEAMPFVHTLVDWSA